MAKEYQPPTRNEALKNLSDGYEASGKTPKPNETTNDLDSVKQRLEAGEKVAPIELLSYGFYKLGESKKANKEEGEK